MCAPAVGVAMNVLGTAGGMMGQQQQAQAQYQAAKNQRQQVINEQRSRLTLDTARYHRKQADRERADMSAVRASEEGYLGKWLNHQINVYNKKTMQEDQHVQFETLKNEFKI